MTEKIPEWMHVLFTVTGGIVWIIILVLIISYSAKYIGICVGWDDHD